MTSSSSFRPYLCSDLTPPPPPPPATADPEQKQKQHADKKQHFDAQAFLSLLRSIEKTREGDSNREGLQEQYQVVLDTLFHLDTCFSRRGLCESPGSRDTVNSTDNNTDGFLLPPSGSRKRQKRGGKSAASSAPAAPGSNKVGTMTSEERVCLLALTRILSSRGSSTGAAGCGGTGTSYPLEIIEAAADAIKSLCDHVKYSSKFSVAGRGTNPSGTSAEQSPKTLDVRVVELELIAGSASQWLSSFVLHVERCLSILMDGRCRYFGVPVPSSGPTLGSETGDAQGTLVAAASCASSCLSASSAIVTLLGIRLSRNGGLSASLQSVAWSSLGSYYGTMNTCHPEVLRTAAGLASSLPLVGCASAGGGKNKQTRHLSPAILWSEAVDTCLSGIGLAADSAWCKRLLSSPFSGVDDEPLADVDQWLANFRSALTSQPDRQAAVLCRLTGLVHLTISLLNMDGYGTHQDSSPTIMLARFPLSKALAVSELLIRFGTGTEVQYATMSNRTDIVNAEIPPEDGSLLSLNSVIPLINPVRGLGHDLLVAVMTTAGPSLLTEGEMVSSLVHSSMMLNSSSAVRRQASLSLHPMTPQSLTSEKGFSGKGEDVQWLHKAVLVRRKAVQSVKVALLVLGSSAVPLLSKTSILIGSCILETLAFGDLHIHDGGDWATLNDRIELATESLDALSAYISVGGCFLSVPIRSALESILVSCLSSLTCSLAQAPACFSPTKKALLQLAASAVCIPWKDGTASTLNGRLRYVAAMLKTDRDPSVALAAYGALSICDALSTPRAPPLVCPSRSNETVSHLTENHAEGMLLDQLRSARNAVVSKTEEEDNCESKDVGGEEPFSEEKAGGLDDGHTLTPHASLKDNKSQNRNPVVQHFQDSTESEKVGLSCANKDKEKCSKTDELGNDTHEGKGAAKGAAEGSLGGEVKINNNVSAGNLGAAAPEIATINQGNNPVSSPAAGFHVSPTPSSALTESIASSRAGYAPFDHRSEESGSDDDIPKINVNCEPDEEDRL